MRKFLLSAFTTAIILSGGILAGRAVAMAPSATPALGAAAADAGLVQEAAVVCGNNGCAPVQTKAPQKRKFQPLGHG
jgi:hypothetical protein